LNAAIAALQELNKASKAAHEDEQSSPIFEAILATITVIKAEAQPRTSIDTSNIPSPTSSFGASSSPPNSEDIFERLRNAVIYIQITSKSDEQMKNATNLLKTLRSKSLIAPRIEEIEPRKMPNRIQVRYFNQSDEAGAEVLAKVVSENTRADVDTVKPAIDAKPGTLEVWFNKASN